VAFRTKTNWRSLILVLIIWAALFISYSINWIHFWIHHETFFRFSKKVHSIYKSESCFGFGDITVVYLPWIALFTAKRSFNLRSESETGLTVNLNPDSIIEYHLVLPIWGKRWIIRVTWTALRTVMAMRPSLHSMVSLFTSPYSSPIVIDLGLSTYVRTGW